MNKKLQAHSAIFFANTIFGLGVPVTKLLLDEWVTPMGYMASRSLGACILFWLIAAFMPKEHVERKDLITILFGGLLGFVISQTLTAWSLDYTSPIYFSLIATLTPVAVMLCAALTIGEKITPMKSLGVLLGIAGAILMVLMSQSLGSGKNDLIGICLAILSVLTWAIYLTSNPDEICVPHLRYRYCSHCITRAFCQCPLHLILGLGWSSRDGLHRYWRHRLGLFPHSICDEIPPSHNGIYLHQSPARHRLVCSHNVRPRFAYMGQTRSWSISVN